MAEDINWEEVYDTFLSRLYHFFCYKVGDSQVAEELTAVTFEKAWKSRRGFRQDRGQVQNWVFGIARHVAGDYIRKPFHEVALEEIPEIPESNSLDEDLQRQMDFQIVSKILSTFPERDRELISLKYGAELTNREIARLTGLSESNVGTILSRGVTKLRKEWEQDHG